MPRSMKVAIFPILACLWTSLAWADQLLINGGAGPQPHASQRNQSLGADFTFWSHARSYRQELLVGVGYSYLGTDTVDNSQVSIWSLFPQLNLYAPERSGVLPFFFVRALGPSYLNSRKYGEREQAKNFAFQAQVGVGLIFGEEKDWSLSVSYKHFSNANLFNPNDGFDIPVVISIAWSW
ncbi:MAG: acyloxyacyl hydrolase [Gammaproteobacteria bacterium]|nr:acyloxyacyl hydrolase [Gammaproteobacteria bacterium]